MTGLFVRVEIDGKFYSLEIEYLTEEQRTNLLVNKDKEELIRWIHALCKTVNGAEEIIENTYT